MSIQDKTQWCINMINSSSNADPADVLLLLGRPGVGKSSFLEHVTDASGHAGDGTEPVTKTFQIETVRGSQTPLFIMDTPGINTNAEAAALTEIARGIETIRSKARIVGVLYVIRIIDRNEAIDDKLRAFLLSFCGSRFIPRITFVTTHWTAEVEAQRHGYNRNLEELKRRSQIDFVRKGAKFYEHGREFVAAGGSSEFLHWWRQQTDIARHAKTMIHTWYGRNQEVESPRFVQELESGVSVLQTDAARSLGVFSDTSGSTFPPEQERSAPNADQRPRDTRESTPNPPSGSNASTEEGGREEGEQTQQAEPSFWEKVREKVQEKVWNVATSLRPTINVTSEGISVMFSTPNQEGNIRGTFQHPFPRSHAPHDRGEPPGQPREWPKGFDRKSPIDNMKVRGYDSSLQSRKQKVRDWGITLPGTPGDLIWGTAFNHELNKREPW
ncbi:hypothetical protein AYL99_02075 [Fonsecaea erecta]|uniref:G domain-containing protein n=1 Tax=Fonsecaea erecta TaxID=1367422 RepID=A0A178ZSQ7_9EURO|nr:hypothetical protein AYL99_02075 [Fonsecaea erecta]OAP62848.1 hypothetical protein AYL99_02075 [Fonsecaea erecta]